MGDGVADARVDVTQVRVAERPWRLQVEDMSGGAVIGEPEVPQPAVGQPQHGWVRRRGADYLIEPRITPEITHRWHSR